LLSIPERAKLYRRVELGIRILMKDPLGDRGELDEVRAQRLEKSEVL